jgi:hypothetical protein
MKYIFTLISLITLQQSISQCNPTTDRMMVIGDSWAFFSWTGNSYNENLNRFGLSDISCFSNINLAVNGAEASDYFSNASRKQELIDYVSTHPELEIIHLSLGGNDAMGSWNKNMTAPQEDAILSAIMTDIKSIIDTIHFYNSNVDIHLSGYDFPNFDETVGTAFFPTLHPFYGTWDGMGQPNAAEVNAILIKATNAFADSANAWNKVTFVNNLGLMQWTYGQISALTVPPYGTYPPLTAPVPGGFPNYPTPLDALNFGGNDSFHLNDNSFELFIKRHFEEFYWAYFRNADQTFIADNTLNNGWTTLSAQGTNQLQIGNDANNNQIQTILSFNTFDMPDTVKATKASVFIKRKGLTGNNLTNENLYVSIAKGYFGENEALDTADFNDFGDATAISCSYGTVDQEGDWFRVDLDPTLLPYFNKYGTTQLKFYYNIPDTERYFEFSNSIDSIYLDLNMEYDPLTLNIQKEALKYADIKIYPNPATDNLTIQSAKTITAIQFYNMNGQLVYEEFNLTNNQLNIASLTKGIYMVKISTDDGVITKKLIKQ